MNEKAEFLNKKYREAVEARKPISYITHENGVSAESTLTPICNAEGQSEQEVSKIAQRIVDSLRMPWKIKNREFATTASVGIFFCPKIGN